MVLFLDRTAAGCFSVRDSQTWRSDKKITKKYWARQRAEKNVSVLVSLYVCFQKTLFAWVVLDLSSLHVFSIPCCRVWRINNVQRSLSGDVSFLTTIQEEVCSQIWVDPQRNINRCLHNESVVEEADRWDLNWLSRRSSLSGLFIKSSNVFSIILIVWKQAWEENLTF